MAIVLLHPAPYLDFKIRRKFTHVALTTAFLLSTIIKTNKDDTSKNMAC